MRKKTTVVKKAQYLGIQLDQETVKVSVRDILHEGMQQPKHYAEHT